jgi:hypothetical protein
MAQAIVDLVRYAYLDEHTSDLNNRIDGLNEFVCEHTALEIRVLLGYLYRFDARGPRLYGIFGIQ